MPQRTTHRCPLCRHALTAGEYDRVLGIQQAKERELASMRAALASEKARLLAQVKADRDAVKRERDALAKQKNCSERNSTAKCPRRGSKREMWKSAKPWRQSSASKTI